LLKIGNVAMLSQAKLFYINCVNNYNLNENLQLRCRSKHLLAWIFNEVVMIYQEEWHQIKRAVWKCTSSSLRLEAVNVHFGNGTVRRQHYATNSGSAAAAEAAGLPG
jgi:hypothetical protein